MRIRLGIPQSKNEWIIATVGAAITIGCVVPLVQGFLSLSWPKVDGVITQSRSMSGYRAMGVDIVYRYEVAGKTYSGDRFRFQFVITASKMDGRDIQSSLGRYRVGEPVKIAVNPGNPSDSVLEPGPDFNSMIPCGMGLFLLLLGVAKVPKGEPAQDASVSLAPSRPRLLLAKSLAVAAVGLFLVGAFNLYHGIISTQWPSVDGRIVYSRARSGSSPETLLWYEYHVGGARYLGSNYRNGGNITPFDTVAREAAKRYAAGKTVAVYYDPGHPQDALLEPGLWWGNYVAPAFALLLLGAAWIAKKYAEIMASRRSG